MQSAGESLVFRIDAFTPATLPLARLATYLVELAQLYGNDKHVHFQKVRAGSAELVSFVEPESADRVATRLRGSATAMAANDAAASYQKINSLLIEDHAVGKLRYPSQGVVIDFPGRKTPIAETVQVNEQGTLDGEINSNRWEG